MPVLGNIGAPAVKQGAMTQATLAPRHPVFRTTDLTKVYVTGDISVQALRGVNFEASAGEFVVILGPSGSGKSTFLNIIGGLVHRPRAFPLR